MNWQPIETAPRNVKILVCGEDLYGHIVVTGGSLDQDGWNPVGVSGYEYDFDVQPTHWMPCPELPHKEQTPTDTDRSTKEPQ